MKFRMRSRSSTSNESGAGFRDKPLSTKGRIFGFLFGLPFFSMGFLFCWMGALGPIYKSITSGSWPQVPCVITTSEVESHSDSDGTTYSVNIEFEYTYGVENYIGGSYDFNEVNSSGYKGKKKVVDTYPVGSEALCWVNPDKPEKAVLSRRVPGIVYFIIPFTSIFMLVGLAIMLGSLGLVPKKWKEPSSPSKQITAMETDKGELELKPSSSGWGKVIGMLALATFWNGIVSVFLFEVVKAFRKGNPEWFLTIFLIPFVLVGLGFIFGFFYNLLALRNPKIRFVLNRANPHLGDKVVLRWKSSGSLNRLTSLQIRLQGRESATYTRGTDSVTDYCSFYNETIFETDTPSAHSGGQLSITIPGHLMHSFKGDDNKIEWQIVVKGPIRRWPDLGNDYPFTVLPKKLT